MTKKDFEKLLKPLQVLDFPIVDSNLFEEYYNRAKNFSGEIIKGAVKLAVDNETRFPKPTTFISYVFRARDEFGSKFRYKPTRNYQYFVCSCGLRFTCDPDSTFAEIQCEKCKVVYEREYLQKCSKEQTCELEIYLYNPNPNDKLIKELRQDNCINEYLDPTYKKVCNKMELT